MASISYEYNKFEFTRPPLDPLTEEEYKLVKNDFDNFIDDFLEAAEMEFKKLKNPHAFNWKMFFIFLVIGGLFLGIDYGLKALDYYDAGEVFAMLSFIPFFAVFIQPFQWLLSLSKSSGFHGYEREARTYYHFHHSKATTSANYIDYQRIISETSIKEYARFIWDE